MRRIIALSKDRQCIAIADWDTIKIYTIHMEAFLKPFIGSKADLALPALEKSAYSKSNRIRNYERPGVDDKAYTVRAGQGYYHDFVRLKGKEGKRIVALQPVELPCRGVVYSLAFSKRNILWGWTDRGLVKWNWSKGRCAESIEVPLHQMPEGIWG